MSAIHPGIRVSKYTWILSALLLFAALRFVNLGGDMAPWDESFYALRARAAVENGAWLDQVKYSPARMATGCYPPLYIWLAALGMKAFGVTERAARLAPALFGVGAVFCAFLLGRRLFDRRAALLGAAVLATCPYFTRVSRMGQFDVPVAFWLLLTFWLWVEYERRRRWGWALACGLALGAGLMTKMAVPFAFVAAAGVSLCVSRGVEMRGQLGGALALAIVVGVAAALPWHIYMYSRHGDEFAKAYLGYMVLYRGEGHAPHIAPVTAPLRFLFYFHYIIVFLKGFAPFVATGVVGVWAARVTWRRPDRVLIAGWVVLGVAVLMLTRFKREVYLVPLIPPLCILAGPVLADFFKGACGRGGAAVLAGGAILAAVWADAARARGPVMTWITPEIAGPVPIGFLVLTLAAATAAGAGFYFWYRARPQIAACFLLIPIFGHLVVGSGIVIFNTKRDWQPLKPALASAGAYPGVVLITSDETPTHYYYFHRLMPGFGGAEQLTLNPEWNDIKPAYVSARFGRGYLVLVDKQTEEWKWRPVLRALGGLPHIRAESHRYILFVPERAASTFPGTRHPRARGSK